MLTFPSSTQLASWLSRLVQIPSVTPEQAGPRAGKPGEAAMGEAVAGWFAHFGGEVHWHEVLPGRSSVYAIWRGRSERWLGVDIHTDTVGVEQMSGIPISPVSARMGSSVLISSGTFGSNVM